MAEPRREGPQAVKEPERRGDDNLTHSENNRDRESHAQSAQQQSEQFSAMAREGIKEAADAWSGPAIADCAQEMTAAWARYAEDVMRHSSEASRALLRARNFSDLLELQMQLLRDNMQAFLEQSVRVTDAASRMAARPFEAIRETAWDKGRR